MYITRTLEQSIQKASTFFTVVLVTGPRQVGKTTIFEKSEEQKRRYVSLDTLENRELAQNDPQAFLGRFPAPLLIDEIQYAPQLFPYIKAVVDQKKEKGIYWITGSQQFNMMQNVTESLAGRVGILKLQGLSSAEKDNRPLQEAFLPVKSVIEKRERPQPGSSEVYRRIWKGSYPALFTSPDDYWKMFYDSYMQTYIERDVKQILKVSDELLFVSFMRVLAAQTGQLLNYASVSKEIGVAETTVKSWLSVLQTSGLVFLLHPYSNNLTARAIKTPKVYFADTGLACYLTKWNTPETLESGAFSGAIFETYVVSEIIKSYMHNGQEPSIYFYRNRDGIEIDVILEENGTLYPIEIKKKSNPDKGDIKNFAILSRFEKNIGTGAVLCLAPTYLPLSDQAWIVPAGYV